MLAVDRLQIRIGTVGRVADPVVVQRVRLGRRVLADAIGEPLDAPAFPRLSPDGQRLAIRTRGDIWVYDLKGTPPIRLTFGGNPLSCAAAVAALTVMEDEDLPGQAEAKGKYLMDKLMEINSPNIREVRGLGLMIGIEMKQKVNPYIRILQEKKIIALNAGMTVIRLLPPLVITYPQIDHLVEVLTDVLMDEQKDE